MNYSDHQFKSVPDNKDARCVERYNTALTKIEDSARALRYLWACRDSLTQAKFDREWSKYEHRLCRGREALEALLEKYGPVLAKY